MKSTMAHSFFDVDTHQILVFSVIFHVFLLFFCDFHHKFCDFDYQNFKKTVCFLTCFFHEILTCVFHESVYRNHWFWFIMCKKYWHVFANVTLFFGFWRVFVKEKWCVREGKVVHFVETGSVFCWHFLTFFFMKFWHVFFMKVLTETMDFCSYCVKNCDIFSLMLHCFWIFSCVIEGNLVH